jgi:hypothetical protein
MIEFLMEVAAEAREYFGEIADEVVRLCGITRAEAVARINEQRRGLEFLSEMSEGLLTHEMPECSALTIYYTEVPDFDPNADRSYWQPKPAPARDSGCWTV